MAHDSPGFSVRELGSTAKKEGGRERVRSSDAGKCMREPMDIYIYIYIYVYMNPWFIGFLAFGSSSHP